MLKRHSKATEDTNTKHLSTSRNCPLKRINWVVFFGIVLMILLCLFHSFDSAYFSDFSPINGTFQNYNPIRRLLDGQVPYRDFQDYLGLGHLYSGAIVTFLLGGSYNDSLLAFTFLSFLCMALILTVVAYAVLQKKEYAIGITNILLVLMLLGNPIISVLTGTEAIQDAVESAQKVGNSACFIRGLIVPICMFLILLAMYVNQHCKKIGQKIKNGSARWVVAISAIAGFAFCWSNDYGICSWVCLTILTFWIILNRERKFWEALVGTVVEVVLSLLWTFVFVEIFTLGHFPEWLSSTFGTGGYQAWYYTSEKNFYLYNIDLSFEVLLQAVLCILYLGKVFKEKGSLFGIKRYGLLAYANMCSYCAVNEYHLLSGGDRKEVALSILFATILFEIVDFIRHLRAGWNGKYIRNAISVASFTLGVACCGMLLTDEIGVATLDRSDMTYVEQMDGYMTELGEDLIATDEFLDGATVFSTYASGQEVVSDYYQPSGYDYIIHVLGDDAREDYLESFYNDDFDYVATIRKSYTDFEYWIERANWFFYRELYSNYHPVYANTYETYWEKNSETDENSLLGDFEVSVVDVDDSTKKLIIQTDEDVSGVADVYLDYDVEKQDGKSSILVFQTMLKVVESEEIVQKSNYLRSSSAEYIPITITNGYGEVTLTSQPVSNTYLEIHEVSCDRIFTIVTD